MGAPEGTQLPALGPPKAVSDWDWLAPGAGRSGPGDEVRALPALLFLSWVPLARDLTLLASVCLCKMGMTTVPAFGAVVVLGGLQTH